MEKILIVDDQRSICLLVDKILASLSEDYTFIYASNGKEALALIFDHSPVLIITDIFMPTMDGLELIEKCRDINDAPQIIAMTSGGERRRSKDRFLRIANAFGSKSTIDKANLVSDLLPLVLSCLDRKIN